MPNRLSRSFDITRAIIRWCSGDGTVEGLRRVMIGNSVWTSSKGTKVSLLKDDVIRVRIGGVDVRFPKEYNYSLGLLIMDKLIENIYGEAVPSIAPKEQEPEERANPIGLSEATSRLIDSWGANKK